MVIKSIIFQHIDEETGNVVNRKFKCDIDLSECKGMTFENHFIKAKNKETGEAIKVIPMCNHDGIFLNLFHDEENNIEYTPDEFVS